jgi:hypothetical protein
LRQKVLLQGGKQCTQPLLVDAVVVRAANHFLSSGFSNLSREQGFLGCGPPQCGSFCNHVHEYKRKRQRCDVGHSGKSAAGMRLGCPACRGAVDVKKRCESSGCGFIWEISSNKRQFFY